MSSNNWLSMMKRNNDERGRSMASRQGLSPTFSFLPRSASTSLAKEKPKDTQQISTKLIKIVHLLNVKVKKNYFFCFCRLEQFAKNNKPTELPKEIPI